MYITRHTSVTDRAVLDSFWDLYVLAYDKIAELDVTRETLFRSEFDSVMADSTYRTTVVRDDDGQPIAMSVIASDIAATRYLSVPYFRRRDPERLAQGRVHYVMWAIVHPDHQATRAVHTLIKAGLAQEAEEGTLLIFDLPESNQPNERGAGAELLYRMARTVSEVELESLGVSRYYALDFAPSASENVADDVAEAERVTN